MKKIIGLVFSMLFSFASSAQLSQKDGNGMTPNDFIKAYETAISNQRWENIEGLIHDDCVVTFTNGTYRGKPQVEEIFRKNFELIKDEVYTISNIHFVIEKPDYAVFIFHYHWKGIIHGQPSEGGGRGTSVIVKDEKSGNGAWQLISEHLGPHA